MKKIVSLFLLLILTAASCTVPSTSRHGSAAEALTELLARFPQEDGLVYSSEREAPYPLTDAMLARMFPDEGDTADLFCVVSSAVFFS